MTVRLHLLALVSIAGAAAVAPAFAEPSDGGGPQLNVTPYSTGTDAFAPDVRPAVRLATPPEGKALVVVFRPKSIVGLSDTVAIESGGAAVAQLASGTYAMLAAPPGRHEFSVGSKGKSVSVDLQPGQTYFLRQTVGLLSPGPHIEASTEREFRSLDSHPAPGAD